MQLISAAEFGEWVALYALEKAESDPDREPTPDELAIKMAAFAARANGRAEAS